MASMFVVRCPSCAAPAEIALSSPEVARCRHCARQGPPAEADRARLERAVSQLQALDKRRFQHRNSRWFARRDSVRRVVLVAALVLPCALTSFLALLSGRWLGEEVGVPAAWASVAVSGVALLVGLVLALRREARLRRGCSASAPVAPGEPATCFLCGAPLTASGAELAVRCGHCQADNLVREEQLERVGSREDRALDDVEVQLWARASAASGALGKTVAAVLLAAYLTPLLAVGALWALESRARGLPVRYVRQQVEGLLCLGQVHTDLTGTDWAGPTEQRYWHLLTRVPDGAERLTPQQFVGQIAFGEAGRPEAIREVRQVWTRRYAAVFESGTKEQLDQLCFPGERAPRLLAELRTRGGRSLPLSFTSDEGRLLLGLDGAVVVLDAQTGAVQRTVRLELPPRRNGRARSVDQVDALVVLDGAAAVLAAGAVFRVDWETGSAALLAEGHFLGPGLAADEGWAYYGDAEDGLSRVPLAGGASERLFAKRARPNSPVRHGEWLYWVEDDQIWRGPASGGEARAVFRADAPMQKGPVVAFGRVHARAGAFLVDLEDPAKRWPLVDHAALGTGPAGLALDGPYQDLRQGLRLLPMLEGPGRLLVPGIHGEVWIALGRRSIAWAQIAGRETASAALVTTLEL